MILPHPNWKIQKARIDDIEDFLSKTGTIVYPDKKVRYRALKMDPMKDIKVVILGQDPYFDGSANGLAFDNYFTPKIKVSPSLLNIFKEVNTKRTFEEYVDNYDSYLEPWEQQGVLLLNTSLSVSKGEPNSHEKHWRKFTSDVLSILNEQDDIIYLAWGKFAQDIIEKNITNPTATIIKTTHPSPFSANKTSKGAPAFIGSGCFNKVNDVLISKGKEPIVW